MELRFSAPIDPNSGPDSLLESLSIRPAVFALFARGAAEGAPYLGRTRNLRRRLTRLLSPARENSRWLNLRNLIFQVDYQFVGSAFEAQWLLYRLTQSYYPRQYRERLRLKPPALLKLKLSNRFPRCYPTRRLSDDGSLYYGPFPSQLAAERFSAEFLDFFRIRRCVEDLEPHPSHPGCIYSQLRMCLAPCMAACTDSDYQREVSRVVECLDAQGQPLLRALEEERSRASEALAFEQAAKIHRRIEKVNEVLRQKSPLVRNLRLLHAVIVQRGAEAKSVAFFRVQAGALQGPGMLSLDENVVAPAPLDEQLCGVLDALAGDAESAARPNLDHLSLLARWYYSSFREGEVVMLNPDQAIPHRHLIRVCRQLLSTPG